MQRHRSRAEREVLGWARGQGIVRCMLPMASASGVLIIAVAVLGSGLFLWWLLRQEAKEETDESATRRDADAADEQQH